MESAKLPGIVEDRQKDRRDAILLGALRQALTDAGEHRLYRSGKLAGLFPLRTGPSAEAATDALRRGLLETVRTESRGKLLIEWVRMTPQGVEYLHANDSPQAVLEELRELLQKTQEGVPEWFGSILKELEGLGTRFATEMTRYLVHLETLTKRVDEALRRVEGARVDRVDPFSELVPWAVDGLRYLDIRRLEGGVGPCPLEELFSAVARIHPEISIRNFHDGLRRLADHRALRLIPWTGSLNELPGPEYALPEGHSIFCHVTR